MKKNNFIKKIPLFIVVLLSILFASCAKTDKKIEGRLAQLQKTSNLVSLKCTFKNVLTYEEPQSIFSFHLQNEKYFLEYDAIVRIGIDMKEIEYDNKSKTIYIPKAHVIGEPNYDENSFNQHYNKKIFGSSLNINTVQNELSKSLKALQEDIEENKSIMDKAQSLASNQVRALIDNLYATSINKPNISYVLK